MMMNRYEVLILTVPEITQDEVKTVESEVDRLIRAAKGELISFERWGKYKLSYPVNKNDYGIYILVRFEVGKGTTLVRDIQDLFVVKLNNVVMRSIATVLESTGSLEYQRPKSLEESPSSRDVGSFLKEQKVERLLSSLDTQRSDKDEDMVDMGDKEDMHEVQ